MDWQEKGTWDVEMICDFRMKLVYLNKESISELSRSLIKREIARADFTSKYVNNPPKVCQ